MEIQDSGSKWKEYTGKIPEPRPGTVHTLTQKALLLSQCLINRMKLLFRLQGFTHREQMKLIPSRDAKKGGIQRKRWRVNDKEDEWQPQG